MAFIRVGQENSAGIDLYYEDHGEGRPVVLIHGYPLSGHAWEKQEQALLQSGHRVISYDRRGFGRSSKPSVGYDYDTFAADLNALMTTLDLRDASLIGHSMGTGEVTRYLGKYGSERVRNAVMVAPLAPDLLKDGDNSVGIDKKTFDGFMDACRADRAVWMKGFLDNFYNMDQLRGTLISDQEFQESWNVAVEAGAIAALMSIPTWGTDFRADLPKIDVPMLVIQGDADRVLPPELTGNRLPGMIKDMQHVIIKGGPHGIPWTHADQVNSALLDFVG